MGDCLKIVVAGEIDAGKSTLIGRFLYDIGSVSKETIKELENTCQRLNRDVEFAYLLDSFEEERINQLTIDTTQIYCKNKTGGGFSFIDVPGHKELLKNMLSGSSDADKSILVIDVKKSTEEGTIRHGYVLKFLGIEEVILVFNKMDMVGFDRNIFRDSKEIAGEFCNKIGIKPIYFIPISAKQGDNLIKISQKMTWYKGPSLFEALNRLNKELDEAKKQDFCFPIQDTYCIDGQKICVGNIASGTIKRNEIVKISASDKKHEIKEIKTFNKSRPFAKAGESIGLILTESGNLRRGQIIYKGTPPEVTTKILAKIICIHPLTTKEKFLFKCSTQQTPATIKQVNSVLDTTNLKISHGVDELKKTEAAEVVIVTQEPIAIRRFNQGNVLGRFVLQNNGEIYAAGIIL